MNFYNEWDPYAAQWLQNLMQAGLIPQGQVDTCDICTLDIAKLTGHTQHHFFAGIGGWPYALALAGWPTTRPIWSASCPCQPFSGAGQRRGTADERHLWPAFFRLVQECRPECIVGEQVASAIGHGWLDGIRRDLEAEGYAVGSVVLGAHSVGAPHIRQRLYWVAESGDQRLQGRQSGANSERATCSIRVSPPRDGNAGGVVQSKSRHGRSLFSSQWEALPTTRPASEADRLGDALSNRAQRTGAAQCVSDAASEADFWNNWDIIPSRDGKARRLKPGLEPLVDGVPFRLADGRTSEGVSRQQVLKGIGNAIVPQVGAAFIRSVTDLF